MGSMHGISELQGSHFAPAPFLKHFSGFCRSHVDSRIFFRIFAFAKHFNRASQVYILLAHYHLNTGMIILCNFPELFWSRSALTHIDLFTFIFLVCFGHFILLGNFHGCHDFTGTGHKGYLVAVINHVGIRLVRRKSNRNWPECAIHSKEIIAYALPVGFCHKTCQRTESANTHHDQIALFTW